MYYRFIKCLTTNRAYPSDCSNLNIDFLCVFIVTTSYNKHIFFYFIIYVGITAKERGAKDTKHKILKHILTFIKLIQMAW